MATKKKAKKYDKIKMIKATSRATIGEIPKPKVVQSRKTKKEKYKQDYLESDDLRGENGTSK